MGKKIAFLILGSLVLVGCGSYYYFTEVREHLNVKQLPPPPDGPSPDIKAFSGKKR